jgi:Xaa-Pro aminopeptidase
MTRLDRACRAVADADLDALVVTDAVNVRYLTGFDGTNGAVVLRPHGPAFLTDFRYAERARREIEGVEHHRVQQSLLDGVPEALAPGTERVGFEADALTVAHLDVLRAALPSGVELVATRGTIERMRAVKDDREIEAMAASAQLADEALLAVLERGLVGRPETEVARDFEIELRRRGATQSSFPLMCLAGPHADSPHGRPGDAPVPRDVLVLVDFGVELDGYRSDCTRTFATGEIDDEARAVYELVREAQQRALEAVRPGASRRAVDEVARDLIAAAGHGERFGHGLGHGVGLRTQEEPRLTPRAEGELEAGNVVTIEPGVYVPGRFGVRIEDMVVVTEDGHRRLSGLDKALTALG